MCENGTETKECFAMKMSKCVSLPNKFQALEAAYGLFGQLIEIENGSN